MDVSKKRRKETEEFCPVDESDISSSSSPVVIFAHGAGAPSSSDWMIRYAFVVYFFGHRLVLTFLLFFLLLRWKDKLKKSLAAVEVITFDYPCQ